MTARTRQFANALASLAEPGPETRRFAAMVENNREWFARIRAEREAECRKENDRV